MGLKKIYIIPILALSVLTACSLADFKNLRTPAELVYEEKTAEVGFSWWGTEERHRDYIEGLEKFKRLNPDIKVDVSYGVWDGFEKRNRIAMVSKTAADVMLINYSWLDKYSADGEGYYDLSTLSDYIDLDQFSEEDLSYGTRNGKLNAIPIAYNTTLFFYNESIYNRYDLEIPQSWEDLFAAAEVMGKDGIYPMGMVKKQFFLTMAAHYEQESGQRIISEDGKLNLDAEGAGAMLEFYKKLVDARVIKPVDSFEANSFLNGETAGIASWFNDGVKYGKFLDSKGEKVRCGPLLGIKRKDYRGWYKKPATLYAMSKGTMHPQESARLMEYLLNDEDFARIQGIEKGFPISRKADRIVQEYCNIPEYSIEAHDIIRAGSSKLEIMPSQMENANLIDAFCEAADKYVYREGDLNTCASEMINSFREALE